MATGGTIPSNRVQTVRFYNTSSIVERDKNMYYVPRFSKATLAEGTLINSAWLSMFEVVCPPSSAYKDISLSGWSPQDRTLVVKGNIDDFRLVTDEGACLNYFIITRTITKGEGLSATSETFYYGFFITGVEQSGGSSVRITAEPDNFTNVFYLHNKKALYNADIAGDYTPFNDYMKNCYVNRQHYNRVKYVGDKYVLRAFLKDIRTVVSFTLGDTIRLTFESGPDLTGVILSYDYIEPDQDELYIEIGYFDTEYEFDTPSNFSDMYYDGNSYSFDYVANEQVWLTSEDNLDIDNLKVFLNQEESFRFKYQYRDHKYPTCPYTATSNFTKEEIAEIEAKNTFANLSTALQKKILLSSIQYFVVETKSLDLIAKRRSIQSGGSGNWYNCALAGNNVKGFERGNLICFVPFLSPDKRFAKYNIKNYDVYSALDGYYFTSMIGSITGPLMTARTLYNSLNAKSLGDHIYNCYICQDIGLKNSDIVIDLVNKNISIKCNLYYLNEEGKNYAIPFITDPASIGQDEGVTFTFSSNTFTEANLVSYGGYNMVLTTNNYDRSIKLKISEELPSIRTKYYDPVLEAEPYSFWSLSYLLYEMPFNKNRYYSGLDSEINANYYISVNGGMKEEFIPNYTVDSIQSLYFGEGLTFTLSSFMPFVSDSYSAYYYQNMAQMKNQFAVNNFNRGVDLAQHLLVSGPNAVGYKAGKTALGGGTGAQIGGTAGLESANQFMQMVDEAIDWAQSNKVIDMNQKAVLADMGRRPDSLKQSGSDVLIDINTQENKSFLNHYTIDTLSYNSIAKLLERTGYQVNLYDSLHCADRVGWNFIKLNGFDWSTTIKIMVSQEDAIRNIFLAGVTLLHDKSYLTSGHNYETILEE